MKYEGTSTRKNGLKRYKFVCPEIKYVKDVSIERFFISYHTRVLQNTFRSHDLLGRLGGDEFLVFVKGISMAEGENFVYEDVLNQADIALYQSKKKGKNQYSYYEETEAF